MHSQVVDVEESLEDDDKTQERIHTDHIEGDQLSSEYNVVQNDERMERVPTTRRNCPRVISDACTDMIVSDFVNLVTRTEETETEGTARKRRKRLFYLKDWHLARQLYGNRENNGRSNNHQDNSDYSKRDHSNNPTENVNHALFYTVPLFFSDDWLNCYWDYQSARLMDVRTWAYT